MKKILTIAGFDPSGGAGITKDMDVFQSMGIHGISVPTCIVNQGPLGVTDVYPIPTDELSRMLHLVAHTDIDAIKMGVLFSEDHIEKIISFIKSYKREIPIVLDPVFSSKNKTGLLTEKGIKVLKDGLIPLVTVMTPNADEAGILTGNTITDEGSMEEAAKAIYALGARYVILKGGHIKGDPIDILFDGKDFTRYGKERLHTEVHGTGCVFSSLLASYLCLGYPMKEAFNATESKIKDLLCSAYRITETGYHYISTDILNSHDANKWQVIEMLKQAGKLLEGLNPVELVPAVQMNIGFALQNATNIEDVAAFPGRISVHKGKIYLKGEPCFGASSHVARLILGMMRRYPFVRSCANIRYDKAIIETAERKGLWVLFFDRQKEPESIKAVEGKSLDFLSEHALSGIETLPDIIYDIGDMGKEPMIRLFGRDPLEVIKKMEMIRP